MGTGGVILRKVRAKWEDEPTGFLWVEPGFLAASGYPASKGQVLWLRKQGIDSVLTLTEEPLPTDWTAGTTLRTKHVPMKDHAPPSVEELGSAADYISQEVGSGRKVLVHCLAGRGRTMCAIAAYMMQRSKTSPDAAIKRLRELRPDAVERGQEESLARFWDSLKPK